MIPILSSENMYFYLNFEASIAIYPKNQSFDYIVELPETLELTGGDWYCNLVNVSQPNPEDRLILLDCLEYSYVKGSYLPVLRETDLAFEEFVLPEWHKVKTASLRRFHVKFLNYNTMSPPTPDNERCSLLIEIKKL